MSVPHETPGGPGWPARLWLARHGQSAGNVAAAQAAAAGRGLIEIADRDVDVPLSPLGQRQARALGDWFADQPDDQRPTVLLVSPYLRAIETARLVAERISVDPASERFVVDERLRERELGMLNRLTRQGIVERYPDQAELRARLGKFYYRPPSGESWCDVLLRLRSVADHLHQRHGGQRVLIVAHQVVVLCFRYLLERMTEAQIMQIDQQGEVANCSITLYERAPDGARLLLRLYNFVAPLEEGGAPVTEETDAPAAAR